MGGRGGGSEEGEWPTIPVYSTITYFFDGQKEIVYNQTGDYGKTDDTAYFETDEWGQQLWYVQAGTLGYTGTPGTLDFKAHVVRFAANLHWPPLNLAQVMAGARFRVERKLVSKRGAWLNRIYPDWALEI